MNHAPLRTVWLSDIHLGSRACRIGLLLDFLKNVRCETLYLVGDIVDLQSMRRSFYWPDSHSEALRLIQQKSEQGTRVIYVPGNHDCDLRTFAGTRFGNIEVMRRTVHTTSRGLRLLVLHGDEFDSVLQCSAAAILVGATAYRTLLALNRLVHWWHELRGRPYWSLAQHVKGRMSNALRYIRQFQDASLLAAQEAGVDGVICGHIHKADILERNGLLYCNDGDWVESCTALVENQHGEIELVTWRNAAPVVTLGEALKDAA
jgi:UDP-2,3-diacylglucosamine pyrophosphatase LpxH